MIENEIIEYSRSKPCKKLSRVAAMRVLLAEDDDYLRSALTLALSRRGYVVETAESGPVAREALLHSTFDLLLLDLGLPQVDGTEILKDLRSRGIDLPVIVITARDSIEDKIIGLDLGANDYLVKPFDFRELEARVRAVLRKARWNNRVEIEFGCLRLNTNSGVLFLGDERLDLTPKETVVLKALMARPGQVLSKRQIMDQGTDWIDESTENAVEIVVHRLRKKLDSSDVLINTVRGFGYVLELHEP